MGAPPKNEKGDPISEIAFSRAFTLSLIYIVMKEGIVRSQLRFVVIRKGHS